MRLRAEIKRLAGELATRLGVTSWPEGEAIRAVRVCLKAWLAERGHLGAATLEQVRGFVTAHQFTRFADWFDSNHRPANTGLSQGGSRRT